ncbi:nitrogen regulation protein NR(II) [Candidatus Uabimicrobium sp. HlEnr_7]|uniref:two-component system sensor histidine kinase NtrB n=1 Tax=Candidatus Uabimicrobium helgolandensis TaxID=3095367 RepID=UPI003557B5D0
MNIPTQTYQNSVTKSQIYWLIFFRFAITSLCFAIHLFLDYGPKVNTLNTLVLIAILIINTLFLIATPYIRFSWSLFIILQIVIDLFMETILVYITGGILSAFVILYFVSILYSGLFISLRVSLFCASFAVIGISISVIIYYISILHSSHLPIFKVFPPISFPQENDLNFCRAYLFVQGLSFYLVALFSGHLTAIRFRERILHKEILEHLVDGVLVTNNKNCVSYINHDARKMLDLSLTKNYHNFSILKILNYNIHLDLLKGILMHRPMEYQVVWEYQEKKIPLNIVITPITINKKVKMSIIILKDISLQKRMEATIKVAERLSVVNETATMIAHEIRNPLASILGASQELSRIFSNKDNAKILFDIMIKESQRIDRIVEDFLRFSKLRQPNFQTHSIGHIIEEVILLLNQRADNNAKIKMNVEKNITIKGDLGHLKQLFYNLGINSLEAKGENENFITVSTKACLFEEFCKSGAIHGFYYDDFTKGIQVSFSDRGKGIDPLLTTKIFTPFFTTKSGGSGIGLAIVQQILESHRAAYYVESTLGKGTDFVIFFPIET